MEKNPLRFEDLPREDQIDCYIQYVSGHKSEAEISLMLGIFTAYNLPVEVADKYGFSKYSTEEIVSLIPRFLNGNLDEEQQAWNAIIESLGIYKTWDIIDDIDTHMKEYHKFMVPLEYLRHWLLNLFASEPKKSA